MSLDAYIARRFGSRNMHFYHAENLENFRTHCAAGKLLCRQELMKRNPNGYTMFYSDKTDRDFGVLGRVFGNLNDFGEVFQRGQRAVPNIYGPIQLVFRPAAFSSMHDICITPQSIVKLTPEWRQDALLSQREIDDLLQVDRPYSRVNSNFAFCELSCGNNFIPFDFLECIRVEPIQVSGWSLREIVENELNTYGLRVPVQVRPYKRAENQKALQQLVDFCGRLNTPHSRNFLPIPVTSLPDFFQNLGLRKKIRLTLWCRYFFHGTTTPLRHDITRDWESEGEDYTICELCTPGDERPPPKVSYSFIRGEQWDEFVLGEGHCDWCGGVSVRCQSCGVVHPVPDSRYGVPIECEGGCGLRFAVHQDVDGSARVDLLLSVKDHNILHGYDDEDEPSRWWEDE